MTTAASAVAQQPKAGFVIRAIALIVDGFIVGIVAAILNAALFGGDIARLGGLNSVLGLLYYVYFWSGAGNGQTLAMRFFNLKVVKTDGTSLDYVGAFLRYIGLIVSFAVLLLGVIWVAFDSQKQGWHDKIASTYVIRT
jgi:uncharacterized RDD family membrane protein YckC